MSNVSDRQFIKDLIEFIQSDIGGGWQEFDRWVKLNLLSSERVSINKSTICQIRTNFKDTPDYQFTDTEEKNIAKYRKFCTRFISYRTSESERVRKFRFYFFHTENKIEYPKLARINLRIIDKKKAQISHFIEHREIEGPCEVEADSIVINARTKSRDRSISIHIKLNSSDFDQKVFIGGYCTYLKSDIKCGSLVLVSCKIDLPPESESRLHDLEASKKISEDDIRKLKEEERIVRSYLARRNSNFIKIPTGINSLRELENRSKMLFEQEFTNPERKFISSTIPKIMFAAPSKSIDYNEDSLPFIQSIASKLMLEYHCEIDIPLTDTMNKNTRELNPRESFIDLKTTDLFILIYNKTRVGSFSLVELGYAIHACKKCIVFYDKKSLSSQMLALSNQGLAALLPLPKKKREEFIIAKVLTALKT